jgi:DNA-binding transcriptional LysR family regulator
MAGSVATRLLPEIIHRMADTAPGIQLAPTEVRSEMDLFELVAGGDLDVAFGVMPLEPGPFEARELAAEPLVLVVQGDSPLARAPAPPTVDEIARLPLIGLTNARPETGVEAWLLALGASPRVVQCVDSEAMAQALVAAGLGVAILPRFAVNLHDRRTVAVSLGESAPARRLAAYWHRERRPMHALREFCSAAVSAAQGLTGGVDPPPSTGTQLSLARAA